MKKIRDFLIIILLISILFRLDMLQATIKAKENSQIKFLSDIVKITEQHIKDAKMLYMQSCSFLLNRKGKP